MFNVSSVTVKHRLAIFKAWIISNESAVVIFNRCYKKLEDYVVLNLKIEYQLLLPN